jgi:hypothetical protein
MRPAGGSSRFHARQPVEWGPVERDVFADLLLIAGIELGSALGDELSLLVDRAFLLFTATAAEMFAFAQGAYGID